MKDKNIGIAQNGVYIINKEGFATDVPVFPFGASEGVFAGGDNSFIVCIKNSLYTDVTDYTKLLEAKGYNKVFENKIGGNGFWSYSNESNLIFVYYIKTQGTVKLIAEPYYEFSYFEPFEDKVKPCVITSSACDRNYYIRLPDNRLVVIDGGWRIEDRSRYTWSELLEAMHKEMAEICGSLQINIPLWIITHPHTDHASVLEHLYQMPFADRFTIDRILYNFPNDTHLQEKLQVPDELIKESEENLKEWHKKAGKDYPYEDIFYNCPFPVYEVIGYENICRRAFKNYDAVNIKAHDGMRFDLSGVIFEVLHTPDDDMPTVYTNMNDASLVIKMTYKDSDTLWLGDMGIVPGDSCIEMYGEYLKCDAVQVSHHGWGSASWEFFKLLNPDILLWNNSEFGFQYADKYQGYGKTESSTRLFNMPCVKQNYFCNTIEMQYIELPYSIPQEQAATESRLLVSAASDRTFMIRLIDGRLIMINGGWRREMWERYEKSELLENLFLEMQELAGSDTVTVAAFIMTDSDFYSNQFIRCFKSCGFADKVKIENVVCAFHDNTDRPYEEADYIIAKAKQHLNFCNAGVTILYASENGDFDRTKDASLVVKLEINDRKIIFTGNMTDRISEDIIKSGQDIECDIVQVANRGLNDGGVLDFYLKCNAKINLWNTSEYAYRYFSPTEGYEKSEVSTAVYRLEQVEKNCFCDRILPQIISL